MPLVVVLQILFRGALVGWCLFQAATVVRIAAAHEAPAGWGYDPQCCSMHDCAQVPEGAISEGEGGYVVHVAPGTHQMVPKGDHPVHEVVPYGDRRIRTSGDEHRHACIDYRRAVLCIYVQPGSS